MKNAPVVEVVIFKANAGIQSEKVLEVAKGIHTWLEQADGYIRRELLQDGEQWIDIVYWESREQALKASEELMITPEAGTFMSVLDSENITMLHLNQVFNSEA